MATTTLGLADVESWGIQPVPPDQRRLRSFDFAILWGDLAVSLLVMVAGALLVPGLSTKAAMAAIVLGTLIGAVLLSLAGVIGSRTGVPTMVGSARAARRARLVPGLGAEHPPAHRLGRDRGHRHGPGRAEP